MTHGLQNITIIIVIDLINLPNQFVPLKVRLFNAFFFLNLLYITIMFGRSIREYERTKRSKKLEHFQLSVDEGFE